MNGIEIKVGDICKVIDVGCTYLAYDDFAIKAGYLELVHNYCLNEENCLEVAGSEVRVLYIGPHEYNQADMLAIVETIENNLSYFKFIINVEGLKLRTAKSTNSFLEDYLAGRKLKELIPDKYVSELLIDAIIEKNPMDIEFIKAGFLSDEHYRKVLHKDGGLLGLIPNRRRTLELCKIAIEDEAYAKLFIPKKLKRLVSN